MNEAKTPNLSPRQLTMFAGFERRSRKHRGDLRAHVDETNRIGEELRAKLTSVWSPGHRKSTRSGTG